VANDRLVSTVWFVHFAAGTVGADRVAGCLALALASFCRPRNSLTASCGDSSPDWTRNANPLDDIRDGKDLDDKFEDLRLFRLGERVEDRRLKGFPGDLTVWLCHDCRGRAHGLPRRVNAKVSQRTIAGYRPPRAASSGAPRPHRCRRLSSSPVRRAVPAGQLAAVATRLAGANLHRYHCRLGRGSARRSGR
jgi:hypothetical protein